MTPAILTLNAGSTNTKLALFDAADGTPLMRHRVASTQEALAWIEALDTPLHAVGHRVVHGGEDFCDPVRVDEHVLHALEALIPLAPLHQPYPLEAMRRLRQRFPELPQIACFDTAFHHHQPPLARRLPLPAAWAERGLKRYGFHGLSYQSMADLLPQHLGALAHGRVIVAHLGGGASLCAMQQRRSLASTMGFSTLDGLMMGTRCGALDPGVVLHLLRQEGLTLEEVETLLYHEAGLKGVSGISPEMHILEAQYDQNAAAREAIDLFCASAARQLSGLLPALGGLDALVFTGGIGEHSALTRQLICQNLAWLGVQLDEAANRSHAPCISHVESRVAVWTLPTDEESVIAQACRHHVPPSAL
jgi:acetate kinase